jgi:TetR/AcrR family transcriptional regulator, transcriptional repressor for nem operon
VRRSDTKERVCAISMNMLQERGFHGFSFQHIADAVGVKKPSLYDHFLSKEELGLELIHSYRASFESWRVQISDQLPIQQLEAFFDIFIGFAAKEKTCPVSTMAVELRTLPPAMSSTLRSLYGAQTRWLYRIIQHGQRRGEIGSVFTAKELTKLFSSVLIGAQVAARVEQNAKTISELKSMVFRLLRPEVSVNP